MNERAAVYVKAVQEKIHVLANCVGFIDGIVIGISRKKGYEVQMVAHNGHKRKHSLKFQAFNTPDGLFMHVYGSIEGRRHDWTMDVRRNLDEHLLSIFEINDVKYYVCGDSCYNRRWFMEILYQGSNLSPQQVAFNKSMPGYRITIEWILKEVKLYVTTVYYKRNMKVFESPVGSLYLAAELHSNMGNCIYRNQAYTYFGCAPPTFEEYLVHKDT